MHPIIKDIRDHAEKQIATALFKIAQQYTTQKQMREKSPQAYRAIRNRHINTVCFAHMKKQRVWNDDTLKEYMKQFKNTKQLLKRDPHAYASCKRRGLV